MLSSAELQISRLGSAKVGLRVLADLCYRELGPHLGRQRLWHPAITGQGLHDVSATAKHVRSDREYGL